jgi:putrescine aminotransferase
VAGPAEDAARTTAQWQATDAAHWLHPFTDPKALAREGSRVIVRAEHVWLHDAEGRRLLDAMSGLWCVNAGYGRDAIVAAASRQLATLPYASAFFHTTHPPGIALAERLAALAPPGLDRVFFTSSGSEATDAALRLVRRYWEIEGCPERRIAIARWQGFHGSTYAGASLGGLEAVHAQGGLPIPDVEHIGAPSTWAHRQQARAALIEPLDAAAFGREAASWLDLRIRALGPARVAAFFAEPVQAAGGVIVPPETYWPEVARICRQHGVLLVADEVVCGFGRLGRWFGSQRFGVVPDLMTFAKGVTSGYVPLGGVLVGRRVGDALVARGGELQHGHTMSGHPVACAAALANLDLLEREGLVERAAGDRGVRFAAGLDALTAHPLVGAVEHCGLLGAVQLARDPATGREFHRRATVAELAQRHALDLGLVVRAVGSRVVLAPPLVIADVELDDLFERLRAALDLAQVEATQRGWM